MKAVNLFYGFIIFAVGLSLMFSLAGNIFKEGNVDDATVTVFTDLAVDYKKVADAETKDGSNIRDIADAAESGAAKTETTDVTLLTGAVQGGRLVINSISNFNNIKNNVTSTLKDNQAESYIDQRIVRVLFAFVVLFIVIISLQFLRGFKLET